MTTPMSYNGSVSGTTSYITQIATMAVVPETDAAFLTILPQMIAYAELRMYRDLDFLFTSGSTTAYSLIAGSRSLNVPANTFPYGTLVVPEQINVITPVGTSNPDLGTRVPLLPTTKEFLTEKKNISQGQAPTSPPVLLLLDSSWDVNMWDAVEEFRAFGGRVCGVLYDLIPFTHPHTVEEHTCNLHTTWWKQAPLHMDAIMCISQTVRSDYLLWQEQQELAKRLTPEQVGYFYLGSELNTVFDASQVVNIFLKNEPYYLVVGSIEPRKNHSLILDAFELLWLDGVAPNLVIVGGNSWKSESLIRRINDHPLYNKKLFLFESTNDAELEFLYRETAALIIASLAEGFGLPIVEAFQHGAKVICSDIPVFREIASQRAVFFDVSSSRDLAVKVGQNLSHISPSSIINTTDPTKWLTWEESASQLFNRLFKCIETSR
jgi:glycosyltransferase involved in cell wall biosynthesis